MIITKTPYRISFFGGGTDYPWWFKHYGEGQTISTTINKYSYISIKFLPKIFNYKYRIRYFLREETMNLEAIQHPVIKKLLELRKIKSGLDIVHSGDLPARSGIGSSSSFTVGLMKGLYSLDNEKISNNQLAKKSINFEQNILKEYVGCQDQIACTYGGFNSISFTKNKFFIQRIKISKLNLNTLEDSLVLIYLGADRDSKKIVINMKENIKKKEKYYQEMLNITKEVKNNLENSKFDVHEFGRFMNYQWNLKKSLSNHISTSKLDELHSYLLSKGASGGKILGAGGGGFYLSIIKKNIQKRILSKIRYKNIKIKFEYLGSKVIFRDLND